MATFTDYKGLDVVDDATGDGGIALTDNFKELADRAPYQAAGNPGVNDDSTKGFSPGDQWMNTSTQVLWACVSNSTGAAVWKSVMKRTATSLELIPAETAETVLVKGNFKVEGNAELTTAALSGPLQTTNLLASGYARVGSTTPPANANPGDLTINRLFVGINSPLSNQASHIRGVLNTVENVPALGIGNQVILQPTGNSNADFRSVAMSLELNTPYNLTNSQPATSLYGEIRVTNAGNVHRVASIRAAGLIVPAAATSLGTVTEAMGVEATPVTSFSNSLTSTIDKAIGVKSRPLTNNGSGPLTINGYAGVAVSSVSGAANNVGVLIGSETIPTGNHAIYSASSAPSYFAGPLDVNNDTIRLRTTKTPASASASGNQGDLCWDDDYVYVCVAANTWKRAALATW